MVFRLSFEQDWWDNLLMVFLIYYVSIEGYAQAQPSRQLAFKDEPDREGFEPKPTPVTTDSPSECHKREYGEWKARIDRLIEQDRIYLQPELTLADVARQLRTNPSVVSGVINGIYKKNFNDFVNAYRVKEFKRQIQSPNNKHLTLLAVALDCGFNSKSTFNRAFKNATGITPKQFVAGISADSIAL